MKLFGKTFNKEKGSLIRGLLAVLFAVTMSCSICSTAYAADSEWIDGTDYPTVDGLTIQTSAAYPMTYADGVFSSSNQGQGNTVSGLKITAGNAGLVTMKFKTSSEARWDVLYYLVNTELSNSNYSSATNYDDRGSYSGTVEWSDFAISLNAGDTLYIAYRKDGSGNTGDDTAWIKEIALEDISYYNATAHSNNATWGTVTANGIGNNLIKGTNISLTATTNSGAYRFVGWYDGETLLSTNKTYSFSLVRDIDVEGRFEEKASGLTFTCNYDHDLVYMQYQIERDGVWATSGRVDVPADGVIRDLYGDDLIHTYITVLNDLYAYDGWYMDQELTEADTDSSQDDAHMRLTSINTERWVKLIDNPMIEVEGYGPVDGVASFMTRSSTGINKCYPWVVDEDGNLKSTNQGLRGTASSLIVNIAADGILSFDLKVSGSTYGDWIGYSKEAEVTADNRFNTINDYTDFDGEVDWTTVQVPVHAGDTLYIAYTTGNYSDGGIQDTGWLRNFSLRRGEATVAFGTPDTAMGTVSGIGIGENGVTPLGAEVTLTATPASDIYQLEGWYKSDGTFLSSSVNYTFNVMDDIEIFARFAVFTFEDINGYALGDGISSAQTRTRFKSIYSWDLDESGCLVSTNTGINSSLSVMKVVVQETGTLCVEYSVSSEQNWDWMAYSFNTELSTGNISSAANNSSKSYFSGETGWKSLMLGVTEGDTVYLYYYKDGSSASGSDCAKIREIGVYSGTKTLQAVSGDNARGTVSVSGLDENNQAEVGTMVTVTAVPNEGMVFGGWYDERGNIRSSDTAFSFTLLRDITLTARFYVEVEDPVAMIRAVGFATLQDAFDDAASGDVVRLTKNIAITEDITVPSGVTLLLPFSANDTTGYELGTSSTATAQVSWSNESRFLYRTLTIQNGATLTVEGDLIVGGVQHYPDQSGQAHTSGAYAQIINNGVIDLKNRSLTTVYGLIKGNGTVKLRSGAIGYVPFVVTDYAGGQNTEGLYSGAEFPFRQFAVQNVQCPFVIEGGSDLYGLASLYFWGSVTTQTVDLVRQNSGLLHLPSGSTITATYDSGKAVAKTVGNINLSDYGKTTLTISGNVTAGEFSISGYGSGGANVDTVKFLNVPYTFDIVQQSGTLTVGDQTKYRIMPGANVTINDGANLVIQNGGGLIVPEGWYYLQKSGKYYPSMSDLTTYGFETIGNLTVDGHMTINGIFAGIIQSGGQTGQITINDNATLGGSFFGGSVQGYNNLDSANDYASYSLNARLYNGTELVTLDNQSKSKTYYAVGNDSSDLTETVTFTKSDGTELNVGIDTAIQGVWATDVTVTFDKNAEDATGTMEPQTFAFGVSNLTLNEYEFSRTGYVFIGWNTVAVPTEQEPGVVYEDEDDFTATQDMGAAVTLYAQWEMTNETLIETAFDEREGTNTAAITVAITDRETGTFTVTSNNACVVLVDNGDGTYSRVDASGNGNTRSYQLDNLDNQHIIVAIKGDATGDGKLTSKDATLVLKYLANKVAYDTLDGLIADADGSGKMTSKDATRILKQIAGKQNLDW